MPEKKMESEDIMRKLMLALCLSFIIFLLNLSCAPAPQKTPQIEKFETPTAIMGKENFFQAGRFYFSGQPDEATLHWLQEEGVKVVINLRTAEEMETLTKEKYDEPALLEKLGMKYVHIPVGGKVGYTPQAVEEVAEIVGEQKDKILIHCKSSGRVAHLWVAYLINYQNFSIEEAMSYGRNMKFFLPLEGLLGYPLKIEKK
jgi:uncharacterized protein (TIGR01244 family)